MTIDGAAPAVRWYGDGLRFSCRRCGNCCSGRGSVVRVGDAEVEALARARGLGTDEFRARHTRESVGETVLLDREHAGLADRPGDCEWLERRRDGTTSCRVADAKPDQCRSYPFWPRIVDDRESWEHEGESCAGIGSGALVEADEIDRVSGVARLRVALETLTDEVDAEVDAMGAVCELSGRCCDFPTAGHRLYVSRVEAERLGGAVDLARWNPATRLCPAWTDGRCTARASRPLACRTYFCDPRKQDDVADLSERATSGLKELHRRHRVPWDYRDVVDHLADLKKGGAT